MTVYPHFLGELHHILTIVIGQRHRDVEVCLVMMIVTMKTEEISKIPGTEGRAHCMMRIIEELLEIEGRVQCMMTIEVSLGIGGRAHYMMMIGVVAGTLEIVGKVLCMVMIEELAGTGGEVLCMMMIEELAGTGGEVLCMMMREKMTDGREKWKNQYQSGELQKVCLENHKNYLM